MALQNQIPYEYQNVPIPGGGYVTGFVFHKHTPELLYIRTDIGGCYRFDYQNKLWISLIDHVTMFDLSESYPVAIALDDQKPNMLYIACGVNSEDTSKEENIGKSGVLAISEDFGNTFRYETIPALVHGNLNGRGTGFRLVVDPNHSNVLYFASQKDGLLKSQDYGKTWTKLNVGGENWMTFVWVSPDSTKIIAATAGVTTKVDEELRGHSMYISYDSGEHFEKMMQPKSQKITISKMSGFVGQRYDFDGTYFYVTFAQTGTYSYVIENGYSCDSGDTCGGKVIRYQFDENGKISGYQDITPLALSGHKKEDVLNYGFSGISCGHSTPGLVVATTICRKPHGDILYLSRDYGNSWEVALYDLEIGTLNFRAPYMKPEYNGNHSIIHWMSDIKINPFKSDEVWFNSGTGVFTSHNLLDTKRYFYDYCDGIEETVHLNVYSPVKGEIQLLDILGDLGGFAFRNLNEPCENTFADEDNNRYITCINADFSDYDEQKVIITPRGNWTGQTKGGLIYSTDQCKTFTRLSMPFGISDKIDEKLHQIESPNVNSGWVALSSDGENIVWSVADQISLPIELCICSTNKGKSFTKVRVYDLQKKEIKAGFMKVFSDRVNPKLMYGFGDLSQIYLSKDGGVTFYQYETPIDFPKVLFTYIDCANKTEVRGESGKEGIFYLALNIHGLWKMTYDIKTDNFHFLKLTKDQDIVYRLGLGLQREHGVYMEEDKAFYISGVINSQYGFYRSLDQAKTWQRINTEGQMFGEINSIDGDCRTFGRFYIATGSRGVLYGQPL